jgi:hypothetical protein
MTDPFDSVSLGASSSTSWQTQRTEWFWTELALIRARWDAVGHPFFMALQDGRLGRGDIADYAGEHDHVLVAIAAAAREAATLAHGLLGDTLGSHAEECERQIPRWRTFASAAGWRAAMWHYGEDPYESTTLCERMVRGDRETDLASHLVTLQTLAHTELGLNEVVRPALIARYGFADGPALGCFRSASAFGVERVGAALEGLLPQADPFKLLHRADAVLRSRWHLLDDLAAYPSR